MSVALDAPVILTHQQTPLGALRFRPESLEYEDPRRSSLLFRNRSWGISPQQRMLAWLRDHVNPEIPRAYYRAVLGHDLHLSTYAELYARHFHADQYDPVMDRLGWWENIGRVSSGKVSTAFRDFEALNLVTDSTTYGDFKWHELGLSGAAEVNTQTALISSTGIARVAGNQTNPTANTYQTVAITTADTTETWQELGIFNTASVGVLMDRSVISPATNVRPGDTVEYTYILTKNAEA